MDYLFAKSIGWIAETIKLGVRKMVEISSCMRNQDTMETQT